MSCDKDTRGDRLEAEDAVNRARRSAPAISGMPFSAACVSREGEGIAIEGVNDAGD